MKLLLAVAALFSCATAAAQESTPPSPTLPDTEDPVELFNGNDLTGWQGRIQDYWSVDDGVIVGRNDKPVAASTYLFTDKPYREFRLLLEVKQTLGEEFSTMHSAVACLGEIIEEKGSPFGFKGPLLMFCHDWGIWDAHRRNRTVPQKHRGTWLHPAERKGEWNQIEILVKGNRIQMAANGQSIFDFTDQAEMLQASPIGLQLHANGRPQEYRFRNIHLSRKPSDGLLSVSSH